MAGIFINYRRDDAPGVAGRLFDHLAARFSRDDLFMDVDAMKPGMDFAQQLDTQVSQCRVLLAVIGPHWLDAKDKAGTRRLDSDKDYVRVELASALKRDIAVIPVLVDGAVMPPEESLSEDLKPLARRHALELRHTRFTSDADAIVHALEAVVPRRRMLWPLLGAGVAAIVVIAAVAVLWPKLRAKPVAPQPAVAAVQPGPVNPPAAALPPVQPAAPKQPAASASSASDIGLPPATKFGELMPNVAFRGSLLRVTEIPADPAVCQAACRAEPRCVVWTYTQPKATDQSAHCSLKPVIPAQYIDTCCTSAIERVPDTELRVPPPIPPGMTGAVPGVELEGGTYRYFGGNDATPDGCQAACRADGQCLAWDYVRPGIYTPDARCFLKNKVSMEVSSPCCIAGFERQTAVATPAPAAAVPTPATAAPAAAKPPMQNTDLHGSNYRNFELSAADATLCQNACKAENQCLAWTYVHPGPQAPNARCWLKNTVPPPTANACCTSGVERPQAQ
jgi:PAN domain/TIR domain